MPLAFDSLSHGRVAFGFFNIESDMLLCERYFFFADDFCNLLKDIAQVDARRPFSTQWPVLKIESSEDIGDLMGAIHGIRFSGFLGDLYRKFPFPQDPADFKQNPAGCRTQAEVAEIIAPYARALEIAVAMPAGDADISIGEFDFSRAQFQQLVKYVWQGGYPGWKGGLRPSYVTALKDIILQNAEGIFYGMAF